MKIKKKILIIGGTGFIGSNLAEKCIKKNLTVFSLSKSKPKKIRKIKSVKYLLCNFNNYSNLKKKLIKFKFDYVVNCGGYVEQNKSKKKLYNMHYKGSVNLYNFFKDKNLKAFIQIGSSSEYGDSDIPNKEENLCKPNDSYGIYKYKSTKFLIDKYKKKNFPITVLRFYQLYGPMQDFNRFIPQLIKASICKEKFSTSKGKQYRDFLHINDAIIAIFKSIKSAKSKGEIFNIGLGKTIQLKKILALVKKKNKYLDPVYGKIKIRRGEKILLFPSIKKAKKFINWSPKISIEKGINLTNQYYLNLFCGGNL